MAAKFGAGTRPLPLYQRRYPGPRYPEAERQRSLHGQHYRYRPRDPDVRQQWAPPGRGRGEERGQEHRR